MGKPIYKRYRLNFEEARKMTELVARISEKADCSITHTDLIRAALFCFYDNRKAVLDAMDDFEWQRESNWTNNPGGVIEANLIKCFSQAVNT